MLKELGVKKNPTVIDEDNNGAMEQAKIGPAKHVGGRKQAYIGYNFFKDVVKMNKI